MIATIIPAYNEPPAHVQAAVESARAVSDLVVVADDGSRHPVSIESDGVLVVRQENNGPAAAMNLGARAAIDAGATTLCRLDVGDSFLEEPKRRQIALSAEHHAVASWHVDPVEGKTFRPLPNWRRVIYWDGAFCICTIVVSADLWRDMGGFNESLRWADDWDFAMRVEQRHGWHMFAEATCLAGAFDGGHTKGAEADPIKRALKHECMVRTLELGRVLRGRPAR